MELFDKEQLRRRAEEIRDEAIAAAQENYRKHIQAIDIISDIPLIRSRGCTEAVRQAISRATEAFTPSELNLPYPQARVSNVLKRFHLEGKLALVEQGAGKRESRYTIVPAVQK